MTITQGDCFVAVTKQTSIKLIRWLSLPIQPHHRGVIASYVKEFNFLVNDLVPKQCREKK